MTKESWIDFGLNAYEIWIINVISHIGWRKKFLVTIYVIDSS